MGPKPGCGAGLSYHASVDDDIVELMTATWVAVETMRGDGLDREADLVERLANLVVRYDEVLTRIHHAALDGPALDVASGACPPI